MRQSGNEEQQGHGANANQTLAAMLAEGRSYSGRERNCCFLNTGSDPRSHSRFANVSAASGLDLIDDSRAIGLVDWDRDGDLDLWISNRSAPRLRLMRNDLIQPAVAGEARSGATTGRPNFVSVGLVGDGVTTNRDAIGARVEIVTSDQTSTPPRRHLQTLRAGEGFLAQSSKWLSFGLGNEQEIQTIIVHWPGPVPAANDVSLGSPPQNSAPTTVVEKFQVSQANQRYRLVQGSGEAQVVDSNRSQVALAPQAPEVLPATTAARIPMHVLLPAPRLKYEDFDSRPKTWLDSGKPVLVVLWSQTCRPCLQELAEMAQQEEMIRRAGIDVLALSVDALPGDGQEVGAAQVLDRTGFPFEGGLITTALMQELQDLYDQLMPLHRPLPVPTSLLIDGRGRLAVMYKGPVPLDQLVQDKSHSQGSSAERFQRSAALPGRLVQDPLIGQAMQRQEAVAYDRFAKKLERAGEVDQAVELYKEVLRFQPNNINAVHVIGRVLTDQGKIASARAHYQTALKVLPDEADLHSMLAAIFVREKNYDEAKKHCEETIRINPNFAEFRVNLGNVLIQQGNVAEAKKQYEEAVRIDPESAGARVSLGNLLMQMSKLDEAEEQYRQALNVEPNYAQACLNLGSILLYQNNLAEAKQYFLRAVGIQPDYAQAHFNLGRVYAQESNFGKARTHLQRAISIQPGHAEARALLNQINARTGNPRR